MASVLLTPQAEPKKEAFSVTLPRSTTKISMVSVPGGTVTIGGKAIEVKPFTMSATEVTWDAFNAFVASGPASKPYDTTEFKPDAIARPSRSYAVPDLGWGSKGYPAINIHFTSAEMFCRWLSSVTKKKFRLPTEAEWEYAARAGSSTRYYWGNDIDPRYANFSDRNDPTGASVGNLDDGHSVTAPVGAYLPNTLGLHDIAGNVWEWTCSEYLPNYGNEEQRCSTKRPNEGQRVMRGGSWNNGPGELRSAKRLPRKPGDRDALTGFRVVMEK